MELALRFCNSTIRPRQGRSFLALLRRRRPKHSQKSLYPGRTKYQSPARNNQDDFVRDKRPKHLHQMRNTMAEFVQIQSQYNLNFAGPPLKG
jgi:hypothetical protein